MNKKDYRIELYTIDTPSGTEFYAHYPSIKGISGGGKTAAEAVSVLESRIDEHIEFWVEQGYPIPPSDIVDDNYRGKIALRVSTALHRFIIEESKRQDISANALINNILSEYKGQKLLLKELAWLKPAIDNIIVNHKEHERAMNLFCRAVSNSFIATIDKGKYQTDAHGMHYQVNTLRERTWRQ